MAIEDARRLLELPYPAENDCEQGSENHGDSTLLTAVF